MKTLVTIVTYNPERFMDIIDTNIQIILGLDLDCTILIIDNSDKKNSFFKLYDKHINDNIVFIINDVNNWPSGAFNQAINYAIKNQFDYCYLIDQDSKISKDTIPVILNFIRRVEDFSFLASKVECEKTNITLRYFRVRFNNNMSPYFSNRRDYWKDHFKINAAGYTGLLLNVEAIKKSKIQINEKLIIAYDDYDFTFRLSKIAPSYVVTNSVITHPNKRTKYNTLIEQFIVNYSRQIPFHTDFRKLMAANNYMYLIYKYGSRYAKFVKLKIILSFTYFNQDLYLRTQSSLNRIIALSNQELEK